jgi:hypothetical protein
VRLVVRGSYTIPHEQWVFVRDRDLANRRIDRYRITRSRNRELLQNAALVRDTREHHNVMYMPGPDRKLVKKNGNTPVDPVSIRERKKPGGDRMTRDGFEIFKPNVQRENANTQRSTPTKVFERKDAERQFQELQQNPIQRNFQEYKEKPRLRQNPTRGIEQRGNGHGSLVRKGKG